MPYQFKKCHLISMCNLVIFFSTSFRGPTIYTAFYRSTIDFPVHRICLKKKLL